MRTAVVGLGPMGRRHLAAVARVPALLLVAVAERRPEALESADVVDGVRRFRDPAEMLDRMKPDLVVVATTAPSHRSVVELSVRAGAKAILCEKPMACSVSDAYSMLECCRRAGVRLAVNHVRRHVPAYCWLAERIASGAWGRLRGLGVSAPGIGLGCLGTHFVDLMLFLAGDELASVVGWVDEPRGTNPRGAEFVDPGGAVLGVTKGGVKVYLHQIEDGAGPQHVAIDLTGARVLVDEWARSVDVVVRDRSAELGPGRPPPFSHEDCPPEKPLDLDIVKLTADVLSELVTGGKVTCDGIHGCRSLEAIVGTYLSHERGHSPVNLPLAAEMDREKTLRIT